MSRCQSEEARCTTKPPERSVAEAVRVAIASFVLSLRELRLMSYARNVAIGEQFNRRGIGGYEYIMHVRWSGVV